MLTPKVTLPSGRHLPSGERRHPLPDRARQPGTTERPGTVSDGLERWLEGDGEKTVASLIELFEQKSFAILFVVLLGVPALPLPTGGATHVFEIIAILLAAQLIAGRDHIWLPKRWRSLELAGDRQQRFIAGLMRLIRRLERISRPRLRFLFEHRLTSIVFGVLVIAGSLGASSPRRSPASTRSRRSASCCCHSPCSSRTSRS
jgi:hypothetical protein